MYESYPLFLFIIPSLDSYLYYTSYLKYFIQGKIPLLNNNKKYQLKPQTWKC